MTFEGLTFWSLVLYGFMGLLGLLTHWLKQFIAVRKAQGVMMPFREYWLTYWPESVVAFTSGIAGLLFLAEQSQLSSVTAFGMGFIANSIADTIGNRVQALVGGVPRQAPQEPHDGG